MNETQWLCMACGAELVRKCEVKSLGLSYPPNEYPFRNQGNCEKCGKEAKVGDAICLFEGR